MEEEKLYYVPRLIDKQIRRGVIYIHNPRTNESGDRIFGDVIFDFGDDKAATSSFALMKVPVGPDFFSGPSRVVGKLAIGLPRMETETRKLKMPTQIPPEILKELTMTDEVTGVKLKNMVEKISDYKQAIKKADTPEEKEKITEKLRRLELLRTRVRWIVLFNRLSNDIAEALQTEAVEPTPKGRLLSKYQQRILDTLYTTRRLINGIRAGGYDLERNVVGEELMVSPDERPSLTPGEPRFSLPPSLVGAPSGEPRFPLPPSLVGAPSGEPRGEPQRSQEPSSVEGTSLTPQPAPPPPKPISLPRRPEPQPVPSPEMEAVIIGTSPGEAPEDIPEQTEEAEFSEVEEEEEEASGEEEEEEVVEGEEEEEEVEEEEEEEEEVEEGEEEEEKEEVEEEEAPGEEEEEVKEEEAPGEEEQEGVRGNLGSPLGSPERKLLKRAKEHSSIAAITNLTDLREIVDNLRKEYELDILNQPLQHQLELHEWYLYRKELEMNEYPEELFDYPTYQNPEFQGEITKKREFWAYRENEIGGSILKKIEEANIKRPYRLQKHQRFIPRFLSSETPYNGMLLYHGVGVGKTCTAIQVAEMYLAENDAKARAMIIAPVSIQPNFRNEIFNQYPLEDPTEQCTGDSYLQQISYTPHMRYQNALRKINNLIRFRYDFYGYRSFEGFFKKTVIDRAKRSHPDDVEAQSRMMIQLIEANYSGKLIIVDEVHNLRDPDDEKKIFQYLTLISRFANETKLLLMTATPMYNTDKEIIPIINLLRINEGLPPIPLELVFTDDPEGIIDDEGEELLKEGVRGFVSFLRGENPTDFPARLNPPEEWMREGRPPAPTKAVDGTDIIPLLPPGAPDVIPIVRVPLKKGTVIGDSYETLVETKSEGGRKLIAPSIAVGLIQAGVVTFPDGNSGTEGFDACFRSVKGADDTRKGLFIPRRETEGVIQGRDFFLDPARIEAYAPKIKGAVERAMSSRGLVLIFTENIRGSAIPIGMALERLGVTRYNAPPLLRTEGSGLAPPPPPAGVSYAILSADTSITPSQEKILRVLNAADNTRGERIKIVIATRAVSEGVNFRNLREVHLMDAYYHMSLMDQVIGRAIRFRSHMSLPLEERNVTVYAWCVSWDPSHPRAGSETVDEELYRLAEEKAVRIGKVSRILKEHAVDCHMLLPKNDRSGEEYGETLMMTDAQGNKREHNFRDTPGSRECDFKTECAIRCAVPVGPGEAGSDKSTLLLAAGSGSDSEIRREIRNRMNTTPVTSFRELLLFIRSQIPGVREDRVKGVLHRMMIEETRLLLPRGGMGVLEYRTRGSEEVISIRPVEISDTRAPYLTRTARVPRRPVGFWNAPLEEEETGEEEGVEAGETKTGEAGAEGKEQGEESEEAGVEEGEARPEARRGPKTVVIEPPFIEFLGEFANAWKEMNREDVEFSFIKTKEAQRDNYKSVNLGKILSVFRQEIKGVPEHVWVSTLAENLIFDNERLSTRYPYMADPVLRKEYLVQIAKGSDDDTPLGGSEIGSMLTIREAIRLLNTAFTTTGEIIPATRRNPTAKIITMNTEGLIDTIGIDGEVISTGDVSKALIGQGLHGYRSRQIMASRVARYLPPGILRFFIQDMIRPEDIKESVKGRMCDDTYGLGTIGKRLERIFYEFMSKSHPEITIGGDLRSIDKLFSSTTYTHLVCIFVEIITRATDSYRPPHLSGMRIR